MELTCYVTLVMACGRDSEGSASSVEFVGIESSLLSSNQYLLWDDKQSLFKWKGSLTQLQEFCFKDLNLEVSTTASTSERSSTLKSKTITLVLFNSTGTLQVQGPEAKTLKAKLKKLLQLPVDDDSVILVREEEANTPAFNKNGAKSVQQELDFLKTEVLNLWAHVKEKPQEEDLRSENSRLREAILSLKEENKKLVQERDSLNFALQIVSREAAAQCLPTNNTPNERTIVPNLGEPTPCANKPQDSIVKSKKKRKKSKNKGGLNNTPEGKESEPTKTDPKQPKERTTLLIGDSMISRIPGRDLGKAVGHRVIVKPFSGATTKAMNHYLKPSLEFSPNEVILHIGTNDLKTREPKAVAESIVDLARQIESTCDTTVTLSELVCRKDKLDQAVKTANKHLEKFCHQNGWKLIHHENISYNGLNKGGLHLNSKGNVQFYNNFKSHLE